MADAKPLGKLAVALVPHVIAEIHARVVATPHQNQVIRGRRLRLDTKVVETNIRYPPDRSLLGAGVWVLTRTMKRNTQTSDRA